MEEQRISVETRRVELHLSNGQILTGEVFLQLYGVLLQGPQRVGEILNAGESFLPFRHDGKTDIINIEQVVRAVCPLEDEFDELLTLGEQHSIRVETTSSAGASLCIYINLPSGNSRVKDFLNQNKRFLAFYSDDNVIYISRRHIVRVSD